MDKKRVDFLVVLLLLVLGALAGFYLHPNSIILGFLYLGIPSFYLLWQKKKNYRKIGWGLLIFGVLFGTIFDFLATVNHAWSVDRLVFPYLRIGSWPVEDVIGYCWMTLFVLVFYEHFLDDEKHPRLSANHAKLFIVSLAAVITMFLAYSADPTTLALSYFYLKAGFAAIIFPILFAFYNPEIIKKFVVLAFFFFFVWLALELVGVRNQNWSFPILGHYVGWVSVYGVLFPFEEIFFWCVWYPATVVAYYEYFIDDKK